MSEDNWFYEEGGKQQGPVSADDLKAKIETGVLSRSNLVWKEGLPEWIAASSTELFREPNPQPPVPLTPPQTPLATLPPPQPNLFVPRKSQLDPNYTFRISDVLGKSWKLLTAEFWPMVGFFALAYVIYSVAANFVIPVFFMYYPIMGGFMFYTLKRIRGEQADIESIFEGFRRKFGSLSILTTFIMVPLFAFIFFAVIAFSLVLPLIIQSETGGPVIFVLVGLVLILTTVVISILSIVTCLATLLCLDCDYDWKHSLSQSWRAFKKYPIKLTILSLLFGILAQLGMLALFVGIFVTGAWVTIGCSCLYERMFKENRD